MVDLYSTRNIAFRFLSNIVVVEAVPLTEKLDHLSLSAFSCKEDKCIASILKQSVALDVLKSDFFPREDLDGGSYIMNQTIDALAEVGEQWDVIPPEYPNKSLIKMIENSGCGANLQMVNQKYEPPPVETPTVFLVKTDYDWKRNKYLVFPNSEDAETYVKGREGCYVYQIPNYNNRTIVECRNGILESDDLNVTHVYNVHWMPSLISVLVFLSRLNGTLKSTGKSDAEKVNTGVAHAVGTFVSNIYKSISSLFGSANRWIKNQFHKYWQEDEDEEEEEEEEEEAEEVDEVDDEEEAEEEVDEVDEEEAVDEEEEEAEEVDEEEAEEVDDD